MLNYLFENFDFSAPSSLLVVDLLIIIFKYFRVFKINFFNSSKNSVLMNNNYKNIRIEKKIQIICLLHKIPK